MSIVSGYKKFKKYILTSSGFQLVSHWTNANTLQFDDGKTAQAKLGAIDGISSSKDSSSDKIAASTKLVSELNSNLGGLSFYEDATGKYVVGADSVPKKLVRPELKIIKVGYEGHGDDWDHWYLFDIVIDVSECSKITLGGITSPSNWAYIMVRIKKMVVQYLMDMAIITIMAFQIIKLLLHVIHLMLYPMHQLLLLC